MFLIRKEAARARRSQPAFPYASNPHFNLRMLPKLPRNLERSPRSGWFAFSIGSLWNPARSGSTRWMKARRLNRSAPRGRIHDGFHFCRVSGEPREYRLSSINAVLNVHTRVSDLYSNPYDQVREQLRLLIESIKEKQESELLNNAEYGLLNNVLTRRKSTRAGRANTGRSGRVADQSVERAIDLPRPSPRHRRIWPGMHTPRRSTAHSHALRHALHYLARRAADPFRQNRGQKQRPEVENPTAPRVGEKKQGVIGLFQPGLPGEQSPGLSVRFMGIDQRALASYLVSLYCSAAVLVDDAIALLEGVDVVNTMSTSDLPISFGAVPESGPLGGADSGARDS